MFIRLALAIAALTSAIGCKSTGGHGGGGWGHTSSGGGGHSWGGGGGGGGGSHVASSGGSHTSSSSSSSYASPSLHHSGGSHASAGSSAGLHARIPWSSTPSAYTPPPLHGSGSPHGHPTVAVVSRSGGKSRSEAGEGVRTVDDIVAAVIETMPDVLESAIATDLETDAVVDGDADNPVYSPDPTSPIVDPCLSCPFEESCGTCEGYAGYACRDAAAGALARCESTAPPNAPPAS
jgi:hypothetical protein